MRGNGSISAAIARTKTRCVGGIVRVRHQLDRMEVLTSRVSELIALGADLFFECLGLTACSGDFFLYICRHDED